VGEKVMVRSMKTEILVGVTAVEEHYFKVIEKKFLKRRYIWSPKSSLIPLDPIQRLYQISRDKNLSSYLFRKDKYSVLSGQSNQSESTVF
jgi:hypothetical protein